MKRAPSPAKWGRRWATIETKFQGNEMHRRRRGKTVPRHGVFLHGAENNFHEHVFVAAVGDECSEPKMTPRESRMYHIASEGFRFIGRRRSGRKLCHIWITVRESLIHRKHREKAWTIVIKTRSTRHRRQQSCVRGLWLPRWDTGWLGPGDYCFKQRRRQNIETSV